MIPLFASHFSIGKSMLTLDHPSKTKSGAADSIFSIAEEFDLQEVVLVETTLTGFLKAHTTARDLNKKIIFGLKTTICLNGGGDAKGNHKIIIFAKNGEGCRRLNKIYSHAFTQNEGSINFADLKGLWDDRLLKMAIPFYDSFIFNNTMTFDNCVPDFRFTNPTFFIERNNLPFDQLIERRVVEFAKSHGYETEETKSIYYKNREDMEAFQTYKCICGRQFQSKSLSKPNLDHFGSDEFCMEAVK